MIFIIFFISFLNVFLRTDLAIAGRLYSEQTIQENLKMVNIADGVNKDEAIELAQNYLIDNKLNSIVDVTIVRKVYEDGGNYGTQFWYITFSLKSSMRKKSGGLFGLKWAAVLVDKRTGKVQYLGEGPS